MNRSKSLIAVVLIIGAVIWLPSCTDRGIQPQTGENSLKEQDQSRDKPQYLSDVKVSTSSQRSATQSKVVPKQIALTFDDGPDRTFTPQILNILKKNGVRATFFVLGTRSRAHPDIILRIIKEGHTIGNHTWDHQYLKKLSNEGIEQQIARTNEVLTKITGFKPKWFRPPYGATSPTISQITTVMGYRMVLWSVDPLDWSGTPASKMLQVVKNGLKPGGIILLHSAGTQKGENLSNTVKLLPQIIGYYKSQGYDFVTIDKLLGS